MARPLAALDVAAAHERWEYASTFRSTVRVVQYAYPIVLLFFFLAAFTARSIRASNSNANITKPTTTGPGGKPLPATDPTRNFVKKKARDDVTHSQKRLFNCLSVIAALTFVANSVLVIAHAIIERKERWWSGSHVVVCLSKRLPSACAHSVL